MLESRTLSEEESPSVRNSGGFPWWLGVPFTRQDINQVTHLVFQPEAGCIRYGRGRKKERGPKCEPCWEHTGRDHSPGPSHFVGPQAGGQLHGLATRPALSFHVSALLASWVVTLPARLRG